MSFGGHATSTNRSILNNDDATAQQQHSTATTTAIKAIYNNSIYNTEVLTKSVLYYWSVFRPYQHTATMDAIKRRYRVRPPAGSRTGYHDLEFCPCIKIFAGCHFACIFMSFRMPFPTHSTPETLQISPAPRWWTFLALTCSCPFVAQLGQILQ